MGQSTGHRLGLAAAAGAALSLMSCNTVGFGFVSIYPTYDYVDGCKAVKVSGHGFGTDATGTIGGTAIESVVYPDGELDKGYFFEGVTPAASASGWATVEVTAGGETNTLEDGFMYLDCPDGIFLESVSPSEGLAAGDALSLGGCGMDAAAVSARFTNVADATLTATAALTSVCRTAQLSVATPSLADGTYAVELVNSAGEVVWPVPCTSTDTASPCPEPYFVVIGGAP